MWTFAFGLDGKNISTEINLRWSWANSVCDLILETLKLTRSVLSPKCQRYQIALTNFTCMSNRKRRFGLMLWNTFRMNCKPCERLAMHLNLEAICLLLHEHLLSSGDTGIKLNNNCGDAAITITGWLPRNSSYLFMITNILCSFIGRPIGKAESSPPSKKFHQHRKMRFFRNSTKCQLHWSLFRLVSLLPRQRAWTTS